MISKIVKATERGQVTLPKKWRDQWNTEYFLVKAEGKTLTLTALSIDEAKQRTMLPSIEGNLQHQKIRSGEKF